jgi:glucokinase
VDFGPATPLELELLAYLQPRLDHVSYERVCSGLGIPNLYAFLRDSGHYQEPGWLHDRLINTEDMTPIIVQAALNNEAEICGATLDLFIAILGSEAGNMVLKIVATGGIYLAGGIPPRIISRLRGPTFLDAFARKGRFSGLLAQVPIRVVTHPRVALLGAACTALSLPRQGQSPNG